MKYISLKYTIFHSGPQGAPDAMNDYNDIQCYDISKIKNLIHDISVLTGLVLHT